MTFHFGCVVFYFSFMIFLNLASGGDPVIHTESKPVPLASL